MCWIYVGVGASPKKTLAAEDEHPLPTHHLLVSTDAGAAGTSCFQDPAPGGPNTFGSFSLGAAWLRHSPQQLVSGHHYVTPNHGSSVWLPKTLPGGFSCCPSLVSSKNWAGTDQVLAQLLSATAPSVGWMCRKHWWAFNKIETDPLWGTQDALRCRHRHPGRLLTASFFLSRTLHHNSYPLPASAAPKRYQGPPFCGCWVGTVGVIVHPRRRQVKQRSGAWFGDAEYPQLPWTSTELTASDRGCSADSPKPTSQCAEWTPSQWFSSSHPHMPPRLSASINGPRELHFHLAGKPWYKVHDSPPQYSRQHEKSGTLKEKPREECKNAVKHA